MRATLTSLHLHLLEPPSATAADGRKGAAGSLRGGCPPQDADGCRRPRTLKSRRSKAVAAVVTAVLMAPGLEFLVDGPPGSGPVVRQDGDRARPWADARTDDSASPATSAPSAGGTAAPSPTQLAAPTPTGGSGVAPSSPTRICGSALLNSPYSYPGPAGTFSTSGTPAGLPTFGAPGTDHPEANRLVVIPAGDNTAAAESGDYEASNVVYYFAPGVHRITSVMYTGHDSVYVGGYSATAGRAVLDGVDGATSGTGRGGSFLSSAKASASGDTDITWEYLTIRNYSASRNNAVMGNVNGGGFGSGDLYRFNTIGPNQYGWRGDDLPPAQGQSSGGGYAVNLGENSTMQHNCLTENAQGAFNGSGSNITIAHNEISYNGLGEYPDITGDGASPHACGCSGGGKLNFATNATVTHNHVHHNYNAGIWLDFNNTGADISDNVVRSNWGVGIFYEASYNARIADNTLVGNGWASDGTWPAGTGGRSCHGGVSCTLGLGPITGAGGGNPYSAIYIANSGGNAQVTAGRERDGTPVVARYAGQVLVTGNVLTDNFGGVTVYTDTDRYPGSLNSNSSCSVPLNGTVPSYHRQTKVLRAGSATVSGSSVTTSGARTLCSDYESGSQQDGRSETTGKVPAVGMGVFDLGTGAFLGNVAAASSSTGFRLDRSPGDTQGADLLLSAYGGCGPADYFGGAPGRVSGRPAGAYWDNCLWGSRNVVVTGNTFTMNADRVTGCSVANRCGYLATKAYNAGVPRLAGYWHGYADLIARASGGLGNIWSDNTYTWSGGGPGAWQFEAGRQGNDVSRSTWQSAPYDQDRGSSFVPAG